MPDLSLNPADLLATPSASAPSASLPSKLNVAAAQSAQKAAKAAAANAGAPRIDLEPLYTNLKVAISEHWAEYKEAVSRFVLGLLNQQELCEQTDHFLAADPAVEHLHNQLIAGILANVGREPPEPGVAPFVSANDKPVVVAKPVSGDRAEQRLKTEVMQLPPRDRRRLKDVPEPDPQDQVPPLPTEYYLAKQFKGSDAAPATAGGKTNWDLEIRKRYDQPLAAETGEFPDAETIQGRMAPICYEEALPQGASQACAGFMAAATEQFVKEVLSGLFARARANMPGGSVQSVQLRRFRRRLQDEEEAVARGRLARDPASGLLPAEKAEAAGRAPLSVSDLRLALEVGNAGVGQFPLVAAKVAQGYQEGEYETYVDLRRRAAAARREELEQERVRLERVRSRLDGDGDVQMNGVNGVAVANGIVAHDGRSGGPAWEDESDWGGWQGGNLASRSMLGNALDECLAIGQ